MKTSNRQHHNLPSEDRKKIGEVIKSVVSLRPEITFAYMHGSFTEGEDFRDIDIAVYLGKMPESPLKYELALEMECMKALKFYEVDVRVLNCAPLSFQYNVIKTAVPFEVRNDDDRSEFQEAVLTRYLDFAYFRRQYLEAAGAEV